MNIQSRPSWGSETELGVTGPPAWHAAASYILCLRLPCVSGVGEGKGWEPCVSKLSYFAHFAQPTFEHASHRGQRHDSQYSHAVVITRSHRTQLSPHALSAADSKACATLAQRRQGGSIHVECTGSSLTVARSGERRSTQTTSSRLLHRGHWCGIRRCTLVARGARMPARA